MRKSINKGCAWAMVVIPIGILLLGIATRPKISEIPVVSAAFWALILFFGIYVLFFKKPKDKAPK